MEPLKLLETILLIAFLEINNLKHEGSRPTLVFHIQLTYPPLQSY